MFYYLNGTLALTGVNFAVIDCGGVGYNLTVSGTTLSTLSAKTGSTVKLFTYLAVREDGVELFGFFSQEELSAFRMLISVSGVGPKAAMAVLTLLNAEKFAVAVSIGDAKLLAKAQGVGAKTAARIILELKDKIAKNLPSDGFKDTDVGSDAGDNKLSDSLNTLMVLGYTRSEALTALRRVDTAALGLEDIVKAALKLLMR